MLDLYQQKALDRYADWAKKHDAPTAVEKLTIHNEPERTVTIRDRSGVLARYRYTIACNGVTAFRRILS